MVETSREGKKPAGIPPTDQGDPHASREAGAESIPPDVWHSVVVEAPYAIVIVDHNRKIQYFNALLYRTIASLNVVPETMLGLDFFTWVDAEDQEMVGKALEKAYKTGAHSSYLFKGLDSSRLSWFKGHVGPIRLKGEIIAVGIIAKNITKQKAAEDELKNAHEELEQRVNDRTEALKKSNEQLMLEITERNKIEEQLKVNSQNLEEANTALRVLLKKRQEDQKELEEKVLSNMKFLAIPYLEKLKSMGLNERQLAYANILETSLNDIISPFSQKLSLASSGLSPTEISVANLIRADKNSKEIASIMSLSVRTIEGHRDKIRKKLHIQNNKINLRAHLQSIDGYKKEGPAE
jgi:PAS domain S-box-containing protein